MRPLRRGNHSPSLASGRVGGRGGEDLASGMCFADGTFPHASVMFLSLPARRHIRYAHCAPASAVCTYVRTVQGRIVYGTVRCRRQAGGSIAAAVAMLRRGASNLVFVCGRNEGPLGPPSRFVRYVYTGDLDVPAGGEARSGRCSAISSSSSS